MWLLRWHKCKLSQWNVTEKTRESKIAYVLRSSLSKRSSQSRLRTSKNVALVAPWDTYQAKPNHKLMWILLPKRGRGGYVHGGDGTWLITFPEPRTLRRYCLNHLLVSHPIEDCFMVKVKIHELVYNQVIALSPWSGRSIHKSSFDSYILE